MSLLISSDTDAVRRRSSPAALLDPEQEAVPFRGRERELAALLEWCLEPESFALRLLQAPGGQGKTRLARELVRRMSSLGWTAGFVSTEPLFKQSLYELSNLFRSDRSVLLVVDDAETRVDDLHWLVRAAIRDGHQLPLRTLLLARTADDWWAEFEPEIPFAAVSKMTLPNLDDDPVSQEGLVRSCHRGLCRCIGPSVPDSRLDGEG